MKKIFFAVIALVVMSASLSWATVNTATGDVTYNCNGTTTSYTYPFKIFTDTELTGTVTTSTGAKTTLVRNVDYTVTGAGVSTGGTFVLTTGSVCQSGSTLEIKRNIPLVQQTDYVDGEAFSAESLEDALDKVVMMAQQLNKRINDVSGTHTGITPTGVFLTSEYADLESTLAASGSGSNEIWVDDTVTPTVVTVSANKTIRVIGSGYISGSGSVTFASGAQFYANSQAVLDPSLTLTGLPYARPEWWGTGDAAIQACLDASGPCIFQNKSYSAGTTELTVTRTYKKVEGEGPLSGIVWDAGFSGVGLTVSGVMFRLKQLGLWKPMRASVDETSSYALVNSTNTGHYDGLNLIHPTSSSTYQGWYFGVKLSAWTHFMTNSRLTAYSRALWLDQMNEFSWTNTTASVNFGYAVYVDRGTQHSFMGGGIEGTPNVAMGVWNGTSSHATLAVHGMYMEGASENFIYLRGDPTVPMRGVSIQGNYFGGTAGANPTQNCIDASGTRGLVIKANNIYGCSISAVKLSGYNYQVDLTGNDASSNSTGYIDVSNNSVAWSGTLHDPLQAKSTWNIGTTAAGASTNTTITVTDASPGDLVEVNHTKVVNAAEKIDGIVSAANTVAVTYWNRTGASVTPGSGTLYVTVRKRRY